MIVVAVMTPLVVSLLIGWIGVEHARSLSAQAEAAQSFQRERALLTLSSAVTDADSRAAVERLLVGVDDAIAAAARAGDQAALRRMVAQAVTAERARAADRLAGYAEHLDEGYRLLVIAGVLSSLVVLGIILALWRAQNGRHRAALAAHEVAERHAAILTSTADTLLIVTPHGKVEMINPAGIILLGYTADELERSDIFDVLRLGLDLVGGEADRMFLSDQTVRHREGHDVIVDIAVGVMRRCEGNCFVLSLRDATERRRAEQAKDELISTVSHELRTPLTSLVGSLALLRAGEEDECSPSARRLIEIADNNAQRLIRLVDDILDIDRIGTGQLTIAREPLDLREIVAQAALDGEGLARRQNVRLNDAHAPGPLMVRGDAGRLLQVVTNLISNAIRASPADGEVTLRTYTSAGRAIVTVADRGTGIPQTMRSRLFHRFQSQRVAGGIGLGLAISREIVRRLDGSIWFEDRVDGGTRFLFALPLLPTRSLPPSPGPALPAILHLEDDADLRALVAVALSGIAHVIPASGLTEARRILGQGGLRLALLDMEVVDGHGPELIPDLIDDDGEPLPIVILSGEDVSAALAARAAAVLRKGHDDMETVSATVHRLLERRRDMA